MIMKKAEDIFNLMCEEMPWSLVGKNVIKPYIIEAIKIAQIDTIEETVKLCAENAKLLFHDGFWKEDKQLEYFQSGENNLQVSKQSILNCAEILKKEL